MGGLLLLLLLIILVPILLVLNMGTAIFRGLFGGSSRQNTSTNGQPFSSANRQSGSRRNSSQQATSNSKVFSKDEGEYVDFVEYKNEQ